uniref:Restriction endonuclease n=1 Tax=viral metagenome TaxID=1070528 RepID=A0A6C0ANP0_9ZZZZ
MQPAFNKTYKSTIQGIAFGSLSDDVLKQLFSDGRIFSHFMERMLAQEYGLTHVTGCKGHDLVDPTNPEIKYEQKTFTGNGCKFMPSNMIGQGRHFDKTVFDEKSKGLNYVIVSNVKFPEIQVRFIKGADLAAMYPMGEIKLKDHDKFFNN